MHLEPTIMELAAPIDPSKASEPTMVRPMARLLKGIIDLDMEWEDTLEKYLADCGAENREEALDFLDEWAAEEYGKLNEAGRAKVDRLVELDFGDEPAMHEAVQVTRMKKARG